MCYVYRQGDDVIYKDELTFDEVEKLSDNLLVPVFCDGKLLVDESLKEIRARLHDNNF